MTFVGNDILVLEKSDGVIRLIRNGILQQEPVLDETVANDGERGMLGITFDGSKVYVYFTAADIDAGKAIENRIYKYDWNGEKLVNPILLKTLPSDNYFHNGGAMTSFSGQTYAVIGDNGNYGRLQNRDTEWKNDTSVILRINPPGPYYAIGIRNSFGITVDPVTGNLWDTENGDDSSDEINFVPENFNSGWIEIMGITNNQTLIDSLPKYGNFVYSNPEFVWEKPVCPTGITFSTSEKFAQTDSIFVGDCNNGNLYRFNLNKDRTGFVFSSFDLQDNTLNVGDLNKEILFGTGFGAITDVEEGPDGFLYIVSISNGKIYRIIPKEITQSASELKGGGCLIATAAYGSELAPQVQQLRELRDNSLLQTASGTSFMNTFNQLYYLFSPTIADWERENPIFKEAVKLTLTPMISSLSILNYVDMDSESKVLGYGISLILLNVGMYFVAPAITVWQIKKRI
ncbi:MAG TPA: PQQ-dependent sugar dehydrogenase [Nitrosarchaeum sp.]|nr:PQQ-dependent sugar dehydrogenase [Nitrosarchaeum sp.]